MNEPLASTSRRRTMVKAIAGGVVLVALLALGVLIVSEISELIDAATVQSVMKAIGLNYATLKIRVDGNLAGSMAIYVAVYVALAALLLPGSGLMVMLAGLFFGVSIGLPLSLVGSALAALAAYEVARHILADWILRTQPGLISRLRTNVGRHAFGYLVCLRLVPGIPFAVANVAAPVAGISRQTFFWASLIGFVPSRWALSTAGAGLGHVILDKNTQYEACVAQTVSGGARCPYDIALSSLLTREVVLAGLALAALALLPALLDGVQRARAWLLKTHSR